MLKIFSILGKIYPSPAVGKTFLLPGPYRQISWTALFKFSKLTAANIVKVNSNTNGLLMTCSCQKNKKKMSFVCFLHHTHTQDEKLVLINTLTKIGFIFLK